MNVNRSTWSTQAELFFRAPAGVWKYRSEHGEAKQAKICFSFETGIYG